MAQKDTVDAGLMDESFEDEFGQILADAGVNITHKIEVKGTLPKLKAPKKQPKKKVHPKDVGKVTFFEELDDFMEADWMDFPLNILPKLIGRILGVQAVGDKGTGKSTMIVEMLARLGLPVVQVNCHGEMLPEHLLGRVVIQKIDGVSQTVWVDGPIPIASRNNAVLWLREMNYLPPHTSTQLMPLLDGVAEGTTIPFTGEELQWKAPLIIADYNVGYAGTKQVNEALLDRLETVRAEPLPPKKEMQLVIGRTGCTHTSLIQNAINTAASLRAAARGEYKSKDGSEIPPIDFVMSVRRLFSYANRLVAGQDSDAAWQQAVIDSIPDSFRNQRIREQVADISRVVGGFNVNA